jgi:hypothetical protein
MGWNTELKANLTIARQVKVSIDLLRVQRMPTDASMPRIELRERSIPNNPAIVDRLAIWATRTSDKDEAGAGSRSPGGGRPGPHSNY